MMRKIPTNSMIYNLDPITKLAGMVDLNAVESREEQSNENEGMSSNLPERLA